VLSADLAKEPGPVLTTGAPEGVTFDRWKSARSSPPC